MAQIKVPTEGRPDAAPGSESLIGVNDNAFSVMGETKRLLKRAGASQEFTDDYLKQAMSGDYDHLLAVSAAFLDAE